MNLDALLVRVEQARSELVRRLAELDLHAWQAPLKVGADTTDLFGLAYHIIRRDTDLLRTAAERLYESRLASREQDLPK